MPCRILTRRRWRAVPTSRPPQWRLSPLRTRSKPELNDVTIPTKNWQEVQARVDKLWQPQFAPHHSILGQNGAGKSHLIVHGILPLCQHDNVAIFDSKGDDPVLMASGARAVRKLPSRLRRSLDNDNPKDGWYRIVIADDVGRAREQVGLAFERIYSEGNWIVVVDETRAIS